MIHTTKNNIKLIANENNTVFSIFTYDRIIVQPLEKKIIHLPYYKKDIKDKYPIL